MASASIARADLSATLRLATRAAGILLTLMVALPLNGLWRLARRPSPWPRWFLGAVARVAGARVRSIGQPLRRDVVILANHQSWLDILTLAGASGTAFVAKGELADVPVVGWLCSLHRTVFVARGERLGVADQVATLRAALGQGEPVALFPEGTTGDGTRLLPFKPALLAALDPPPPGLRVQPVLIDYGAAASELAWPDAEGGLDNVRRILSRADGFDVTLTWLDPFDPAAAGGRKAIAAEARARLEAAMIADNWRTTAQPATAAPL